MNYLIIGLVLIAIIIIYYLYYYFTNNSLTAGLQELNKVTSVQYQTLKNPTAITYSYQCWIYMSAPTVNATPIFSRGATYREFQVDLSGQILSLKCGTGAAAPTPIMTITNNFPIQKWTYLVINVYNLKTFEAYINGKLVKTVNVSNTLTPTSKMSDLVIGNVGLSGYVTKFTRVNNTMDAKTVWTTYLSGNGLSNAFSSIMPYGLTMSVANGEDIQRIFKLF